MIPESLFHAVQTDDDESFDALVNDESLAFIVDWREDDAEIVAACESVLDTGKLSAEWKGEQLFIRYGQKQLHVPLTLSLADRHITLLSLNQALTPDFEVRLLYASFGNDSHSCIPLATADWSTIEHTAPEVVRRRFHKLTPHPNTFTDRMQVPKKPKPTSLWQFWKPK